MKYDPYKLSSYDFSLPRELIAQYPCSPRDHSRLMVIDRKSGQMTEMVFRELVDFLNSGDRLIFNDTKVVPARLIGRRLGGGVSEVFLVRPLHENTWEVLARPGKKLRVGSKVIFGEDFSCEIVELFPDGSRRIRFLHEGNLESKLIKYGKIPLPHYIRGGEANETDIENYQTIFASQSGALAAPTAGLHFTKEMLSRLIEKGVYQTSVTLHIGLGTFKPVEASNILEHKMHAEHLMVTAKAAEELNLYKEGKRRICVGTTSCRALESISTEQGMITPGAYETNIFIYPGYHFKFVEAMLTNFHLPQSSLLMLVSAFGGYELIREAYRKAVKEKYRFFSYGDAMLIL